MAPTISLVRVLIVVKTVGKQKSIPDLRLERVKRAGEHNMWSRWTGPFVLNETFIDQNLT